MKWPDLRLFGLWRRLARLQHEQAVESRVVVDDVKETRRRATCELADQIFHLHAITESLEEVADDAETDPESDP